VFFPAVRPPTSLGFGIGGRSVTVHVDAVEALAKLSAVLEHSSDFVSVVDVSGRLVYANETVRRFFGVDTGADLRGLPPGLGFSEESQRRLRNEVWPRLLRDGVWNGELLLVSPEGRQLPVWQGSRLHRDDEGRPSFVAGSGRDLSGLKEAEGRVAESEARFRALVQHSQDLIAIVDARGRFTYASPSYARILGYDPTELIGCAALELVHPDDRVCVRMAFTKQLLEGAPTAAVAFQHSHHNGGWRDLEAVASALFNEPSVRGVVVNSRDVTARRRAEAELNRFALHDPLTGIPNRGQAIERLRDAVRERRRGQRRAAVLFIDLDQFKMVNDSLGHAIGDAVLVEVAARLRKALRPSDFVARLGGDEFIVVAPCPFEKSGVELAGRILEVLRRPYRARGHCVNMTASIGITGIDRHDHTAVLRDADAAMYLAKDRGRDRIEVFGPGLRHQAAERLSLERDLQAALERQQFLLLYQPIVSLRDGHIVGYEALLRWRHPSRKVLRPGQFLAVAEDTGLINEIGLWAIRSTCHQAARWNQCRTDTRGFTYSVNLSARQLTQNNLAATISTILDESGLPPDQLMLELTERTILRDLAAASRSLNEVRSLGVRLALDDFGTGYSSLSHLRDLPIQAVKIDGSFIATLLDEPAHEAIVAAVVQLARTLRLATIAERVETPAQARRLGELGCELAQGNLWSQPAAPDDLDTVVLGA
jgi:diguanylate cyclase (GGDEF)-like protein/PAS domain S-box-containing protein